ncbi:MAG: transposase [Planctomycetota bacterium]|nr:MAG: transposase [Planctomycetota bacterium]
MRQPRERQFDPSTPPWLHCISRCVRRALLCGEGYEHRKRWIERRLALLARHCAVQVGAYAIMSNHLHVVLRPRPQEAVSFSDEQVLRAWWALRENEDLDVDPARAASPEVRGILEARAQEDGFLARWRARLGSVSWFMKAVKEPLSRLANREDDCTGAFWEGRFRSIPLLDTAAITTCMVYVDLNPIRAQLATTPETSAYTSVKARIEARQSAAASSRSPTSPAQPEHPWLTPITAITSSRKGDPGLSLDEYLKLVDGVGRRGRADKPGSIPADLTAIIQRLDAELVPGEWVRSMLTPRSLGGSALGKLGSLASEAKRRGMQWLQDRCRLFAPAPPTSTTPSAIQ